MDECAAAKRRDGESSIRFSPTGLNLFNECNRCGWLKYNGLPAPRGKYPSLPGGVDVALKQLSDLHRLTNKLPPLWGSLLPGRRLYHEPPRTLSWKWDSEDVVYAGTPDEWLIESNGSLSVMDFKTRGFASKPEIYPGYQFQLDSYALLAERTGEYPRLSGRGYLLYFIPELRDGDLSWHPEVLETLVNPRAPLDSIRRAGRIVRGPVPNPASACEMCAWAANAARRRPKSPWLE